MSKNKDLKIEKTSKLSEQIKGSKALVLTDYTGLTVAQINELRTKVKATGGDYTVIKNTLLRIALKDANLPVDAVADKLNGPTGLLLATTDEVNTVKALAQFAKASGIPSIKAGILGDRALTA